MLNVQTVVIAVALGGVVFYAISTKRKKMIQESQEQSHLTEAPKKTQKSNKTLLDSYHFV